jgi:pilus assembly protein CpaE
MSSSTRPSTAIGLALFSVCADRELVSAALDVTSGLPGAEFVGEFHDYITADKRPQFDSSVSEAAACVALVDFDRNPELALKTAERLREIFRNKVSIIALASQLDANLILQAMRSGCNEYLTKPVDLAALATALAQFQSSADTLSLGPQNRAHIITLSGAKGGVGTTALAVHLATHLVHTGKKTLLIDYHPDLGDVGLYLGIAETPYCFDDVLANAERLDADLLKGFITRHSSGLDIITSPDTGRPRQERTAETLERVIAVLRREYEWIVIDSPLASEEFRLSLLQHTDHAYLVSTTDIASLRDLRRRIERMSLADADKAKVQLVLNRVTDADAVTSDQIRDTLGFPIAASLPNSYADILQAINKGEPLDPNDKRAFTKRVAVWAGSIAAAASNVSLAKSSRKRFAFWGR